MTRASFSVHPRRQADTGVPSQAYSNPRVRAALWIVCAVMAGLVVIALVASHVV